MFTRVLKVFLIGAVIFLIFYVSKILVNSVSHITHTKYVDMIKSHRGDVDPMKAEGTIPPIVDSVIPLKTFDNTPVQIENDKIAITLFDSKPNLSTLLDQIQIEGLLFLQIHKTKITEEEILKVMSNLAKLSVILQCKADFDIVIEELEELYKKIPKRNPM